MGDAVSPTRSKRRTATDDAKVSVRVLQLGEEVDGPEVDPGDGFAKNDIDDCGAWRSNLIRVDANDELGREEGAAIRCH